MFCASDQVNAADKYPTNMATNGKSARGYHCVSVEFSLSNPVAW